MSSALHIPASAWRAPSARATPAAALASFVSDGWRERLIRELAPQWMRLGYSEVEDAVDYAIAEAFEGSREPEPARLYSYVRTAAWRHLAQLQIRSERPAAPRPTEMDLDGLVNSSVLSPEELTLLKEERQLFLDACAALADEDRAILRALHVQRLKPQAAARVFDKTERQVRRCQEKASARFAAHYSAASDGSACASRRLALAALAQGLAGPAEREQAERHIDHCAACARFFRAVVATRRAAAALIPLPILPGDHAGILERAFSGTRALLEQLRLLPAQAAPSGDGAAQALVGARAGAGAAGAGALKLLGVCLAGGALSAGGVYCVTQVLAAHDDRSAASSQGLHHRSALATAPARPAAAAPSFAHPPALAHPPRRHARAARRRTGSSSSMPGEFISPQAQPPAASTAPASESAPASAQPGEFPFP